jgi:hypothetical protein
MNSDLARLVVVEAFRACDALRGLLQPLKEDLSEAEYRKYLLAIGSCVAQIGDSVLERVYADVPGLEESVKANIEKSGRAF